MHLKTGRPTDNPKTHKAMFRLSEKEVKMLDFCAEQTGRSRADIVREGIEIVYKRLKKK